MAEAKDYSALTLEELLAEEKKIKRNEITGAVVIGFLVGVMIFGVASNGFGIIYTVIPILLIGGIARHSGKQKQVLREIQTVIRAKEQ
jgi:hypothetical protein